MTGSVCKLGQSWRQVPGDASPTQEPWNWRGIPAACIPWCQRPWRQLRGSEPGIWDTQTNETWRALSTKQFWKYISKFWCFLRSCSKTRAAGTLRGHRRFGRPCSNSFIASVKFLCAFSTRLWGDRGKLDKKDLFLHGSNFLVIWVWQRKTGNKQIKIAQLRSFQVLSIS